jgi:Fibronectin type III-like domain
LSGRIGAAYVRGLQVHGVAATAKHYVANDSETNPFGHGLGYTTWAYERIDGPASVIAGEDLTIQVQVRNAGLRGGKEVIQVYLSRPASSIDRPAVWLGGYAVVNVAAGQEVTAPISVGAAPSSTGQSTTTPGVLSSAPFA